MKRNQKTEVSSKLKAILYISNNTADRVIFYIIYFFENMIPQIKRYIPQRVKRYGRRVIESQLLSVVAENNNNKPAGIPARVEIPEEVKQAIAVNNRLSLVANSTTSQNGEDGIIAEILKIIGIKEPNWCVEFGACDGKRDSNTWGLINEKGWSGVLIEPEPDFCKELQENYKQRSDVYCFGSYVNWEGEERLDNIFARTPLPKDFALLVVDIDGNDYHVWEALQNYRPHVVSIEFQWLLAPSMRYVQPKDFSKLGGASLGALYDLAKAKGYELVATQAWNAFFVRGEHFTKFNITDNRPDRMCYAYQEMRIFQGYDGSLQLCGDETAYWWKHHWRFGLDTDGKNDRLPISQRDIQVLPDGLRVFRPRHTYHCKTLADQAGKLDAMRIPGNLFLTKRRNVASECGEDGILEAIFDKLGIHKGFAVDIGANDGKWCSNSWHLFSQHDWSGIAIEKDKAVYDALLQHFQGNQAVKCLHKEVQYDGNVSLDALLDEYQAPASIDLLCIDIEGNDYHIWDSLKNYAPSVVVVDFNPSIPNDIVYVQSYSATSPFGSSLRAFIALGRSKGYELAAVTDWNAFFVRTDLFTQLGISRNDIDSMYYPPFEMRMMQIMDGSLLLLTGNVLVRQDYTINFEDFQVLPKSLRGHDASRAGFGAQPPVFYNSALRRT